MNRTSLAWRKIQHMLLYNSPGERAELSAMQSLAATTVQQMQPQRKMR